MAASQSHIFNRWDIEFMFAEPTTGKLVLGELVIDGVSVVSGAV